MAKFKDRNFKRVLALMLFAKGRDAELTKVVKQCGAEEDDTDDIHPQILKLIDTREIPSDTLDAFREFSMEAYMHGIGKVLPYWGGEEDPLPIKSFADLALLPNLEVFDYPVSHDLVIKPSDLVALPKLVRARFYVPPNDKAEQALLAAGFNKSGDDRVPILERKLSPSATTAKPSRKPAAAKAKAKKS